MPKRTQERTPFGQRLLTARLNKGLTQMQAANALGISQGTLSQAERIGEGSALVAKFAALYGVNPLWLTDETGEMQQEVAAVDHSMSYQPFDHVFLTREQMMTMEKLPARFVVALPDDAMGRDYPEGYRVLFERVSNDLQPSYGDGVLVQNAAGDRFVRDYAQGDRPGEWLAVPVNTRFKTYSSQIDGLTVLAVWVGELSRRKGKA